MELFIGGNQSAGAVKGVAGIEDAVIDEDRGRTANEVDLVFGSQIGEELADLVTVGVGIFFYGLGIAAYIP